MANIINGTDTGSGGLITTGDSSDELQLQTAETTAVTITSGQQSAFIAGTASAPAVTTTGDLNTGIFFPAADTLGLAVGGSEAARVTSTKQLLVTNNGVSNQGSIRINNQAFTGSTSTGPHIFGYEGSNSIWWLGSFDAATYGDDFVVEARQGAVRFYTNSALAATINTSGNLVFPNGQGIDFSASAGGGATSSLLDDYEEGTWTPTLPNGGTLDVLSAQYIKIGQKITVSFYVNNIAPTNNGSEFRIGGLPYAVTSSSNQYFSGSFGYVGDSNLSGWMPITGVNFTFIYFHIPANTGVRTNAQYLAAASGVTDAFIITLTYFTN